VNVRSVSATGGRVEIRLDKVKGPVLAEVEIGEGSEWKVTHAKLVSVPSGVCDLIVTPNEKTHAELDWISFE